MDYQRAIVRDDHMGILMAAGLSGGFCYFTWSQDGGSTWEESHLVSQDPCADEQPGLAEMHDGSLRVAITQDSAVRIYKSVNAGMNWTSVAVLT